jgi:hypothetical protein
VPAGQIPVPTEIAFVLIAPLEFMQFALPECCGRTYRKAGCLQPGAAAKVPSRTTSQQVFMSLTIGGIP